MRLALARAVASRPRDALNGHSTDHLSSAARRRTRIASRGELADQHSVPGSTYRWTLASAGAVAHTRRTRAADAGGSWRSRAHMDARPLPGPRAPPRAGAHEHRRHRASAPAGPAKISVSPCLRHGASETRWLPGEIGSACVCVMGRERTYDDAPGRRHSESWRGASSHHRYAGICKLQIMSACR